MSAKKRIMREFRIDEISAVDRPAQEGARATLMKRAPAADAPSSALEQLLKCGPDESRPTPVFMTSAELGHAHLVQLYGRARGGSTSYARAKGEDGSHEHPWILTAAGTLEIGASGGHAHTVDASGLFEAVLVMLKRAPNTEQRQALAKSGEALLDGSWPILQDQDVHEAIACTAMAGTLAADAARHIVKRAADLGVQVPKDSTLAKAAETGVQDMADKTAEQVEIEKLQKTLARQTAFAELNDEQREYFKALSATDQERFIGLSSPLRAAELTAVKAADAVIFTAEDGTTYRKSDDARLVKMAQERDADRKQSRELAKQAADATFQKRAVEELPALPGDVAIRAALLKAVDSIADEPTRTGALAALIAGNAAMIKSGQTIGTTAAGASVTAGDGEAKLEALTQAAMAKNTGLTYAKAYRQVLDSDEGRTIYAGMNPTV